VRLGRTRPSRQIRLHFSLKYRNAETLHDEWTNRSNPKHAMYGQWLSLDELVARYAPSPDAISLVQSKLRAAGASSVVSSRLGHTEVTLSVAAAERLLGCVFHSFRNKKTGQVVHRALDGLYTLPRSLAAVVDHVEGVRRLPVIRAGGVRRSSKIGLLVTPKVIRERYQTTGISSVNANNSGGVAQFIGQHFTQSDLNEFYALYDKSNIGTKPIIVGPNSPPPGVEVGARSPVCFVCFTC
jgi:tripeptidyl-peptidase-1